MKHFTLIFAVFALFAGCAIEPNHQERQAVRKYLESKDIQVKEELFWGAPDSVFSSYSLEIARDYFTKKARNQIDDLFAELFSLSINSPMNQILTDSMSKMQAEITRINENADAKIREAKPNRIGIVFEYLLDNGGHGHLIFVFDETGKRISHAQSLNGYYIELKKAQK